MLTSIIIALLFLIIFLGIKLLKPLTHKQPENIDKYKIAIHEAGHFIVAWSCSHVTEIKEARINNYDGCVLFTMKDDGSDDNIWCSVVIMLAGIAAEVKTYGKINSWNSKDDLGKALYLVNKLDNYIPKNIPNTKSLDFKCMFKDISEKESYLLSAAYRQAKEIIDNQKDRFYHITVLLQNLKVINEHLVNNVMGNRVHIAIAGLFAPLFVYPGFVKQKEAA